LKQMLAKSVSYINSASVRISHSICCIVLALEKYDFENFESIVTN